MERADTLLRPICWMAREGRAAAKVNTVLSAGAAPTFQGHSLFPNIFKYNTGHNDSINKSKQNELKGTQPFRMQQLSQIHTPIIGICGN